MQLFQRLFHAPDDVGLPRMVCWLILLFLLILGLGLFSLLYAWGQGVGFSFREEVNQHDFTRVLLKIVGFTMFIGAIALAFLACLFAPALFFKYALDWPWAWSLPAGAFSSVGLFLGFDWWQRRRKCKRQATGAFSEKPYDSVNIYRLVAKCSYADEDKFLKVCAAEFVSTVYLTPSQP